MQVGVDKIRNVCEQNGLAIPDDSWARLETYVHLLLEWNSKINLVSRKNVDRIWTSHILHSLSPLLTFDFATGWELLDIGSGGGLPGIPIAIARPDLGLHLIDSVKKKTRALSEITVQLGLANVTVLTGRVEQLATLGGFRNKFDGVLARGVAPLVDLMGWARPILRSSLKSGGSQLNCQITPPFVLAMKGGDVAEELRAGEVAFGGQPEIFVKNIQLISSESLGLQGKKLIVVNL